MAELIYRNNPSQEILDKDSWWKRPPASWHRFGYDELEGRYLLKGITRPGTLRASKPSIRRLNSLTGITPCRLPSNGERMGLQRGVQWDELIDSCASGIQCRWSLPGIRGCNRYLHGYRFSDHRRCWVLWYDASQTLRRDSC